ncbi:CRISPR-associated protein Cas7 [Pontibacter sp. E15-1]|uniref:CRISPR-associated protein Cas7 n=1 Tax=Pontibacter sp. E15-1 TaxID=2919918 RepID=UPI001F4FBFAE|nr:CRISPR-associated protein Cas7 [Pontibacter sp. E15-1]MCJ8165894.1 CRISPR-associated protein Cas7 [Pontibacter sp. E15-1]
MKPYLYIRGLRVAEHTVFCVQDGQKTYYDPISNRKVAYSSGQQVKRSILDALSETMEEPRAPITYNYEINKKKELENKEPWSPCDPHYADQLIGGWMRARKDEITLKRRSPLSISAMRPLHPFLVSMNSENITFDRSEHPEQNPVRVLNASGQELSSEEIQDYLQSNKRTLPRRAWIPDNSRTTGLFVYDLAIDLKRLFTVATNQHEPELSPVMLEQLKQDGWETSSDGEFLLCPDDRRREIAEGLAAAIVEWQITSNQARTYSPQTTLALAISENASLITAAIRADLDEENPQRAVPIIDTVPKVDVYTSLNAKAYIQGVSGTADALDQARIALEERLLAFDYAAVL